MTSSCYCCPPHKVNQQTSANIKDHMDLDGALQELGMLSSITESRKQYLREKLRKDKNAVSHKTPSALCVVQMNSNYVTNFSFSGKSSSSNLLEYHHEETAVENKDTDLLIMASHLDSLTLQGTSSQLPAYKSSKMRSSRNRLHFYKPYEFPWRPKLEESLRSLHENSSNCENDSGTSQIAIPRQDSGNKSNPGSPLKSQKGANNAGCSIFRSRSLDDLDISKLEVKEGCSNEAGRAEIETVSQRISNLHVN